MGRRRKDNIDGSYVKEWKGVGKWLHWTSDHNPIRIKRIKAEYDYPDIDCRYYRMYLRDKREHPWDWKNN